jgi:hypothetical protein
LNKPKIRSLSQEETLQALEKISVSFDSKLGQEQSESVVSECIHNLGGLFSSVTSDTTPKEWWFFRIRGLSSFSDSSLTLEPDQHTFPPPSKLGGRCHFPGQSVFYASDSIDGCIAEMKSPSETDYLLSIWRLPHQAVRTLKFLCGSNIKEHSRLNPHKIKIFEDACKDNNMFDDLNAGRLKSFITAWSDIFLSNNYNLSAYQCMYGKRNQAQDLLAYGSALDGSYINFAITPEVAEKLVLEGLLHLSINTPGEQVIERTALPPFEVWEKAHSKNLDILGSRMPLSIYP